jgi:hypothetical protein
VAVKNTWRSIFAPRDRRPIPEWAHDYVWLQPPITKTGFFTCADSRHFLDIFASLQNDHKREVNVLKPVRGGGSLIGDIFCPWTLAVDPGPYMDVFQTEPAAKDHGQERIQKIFHHCKPVAELFPSDRHELRNKEILFNNGHTWYLRGPALGNLQGKGIRYLRMEEVWMWRQGLMGEAEGRIGDYLKMQNSKILRISQGGPMDGVSMEESDWFRAYHKALGHEWEVQCINPACGKYFDPMFSGQRVDGSFWGITWNRYQLANGDWDIPKCLPTVHFECPHCAHPHLDGARTKAEWNRTGRYRVVKSENREPKSEGDPKTESPKSEAEASALQIAPQQEDNTGARKKDSFHWEAVIDFPWQELVELWLDACNAEKRGDLKPKLQFFLKRRAMFKDEESLLKGGLHFRRSAYEINSDWPEEKARFMSVDRQEEDLFWWSVRAWSEERSRRLGFGKAYGFAAIEELRIKFKVPANRVLIDSNFLPKGDHGVYAAALQYGWICVRGDKAPAFTHRTRGKRYVQKSHSPLSWGDPGSGTGKEGRRYAPLIMFSKSALNQKVQELIDNGRWEEPLNSTDPEMEAEYSQQMAARVRKTDYVARTGETRVFWKESKNDHARDLANMNTLGAMLADLVPDPAMERLSTGEKAAADKEAAA